VIIETIEMASEKFPEITPGQPLSADRANMEGQVLERVAKMRPGSGMDGRHGGSALQFSRTLDAKLAALRVTDDSDAPVYLGVLRQYNFQSDEWSDGEKLWKIDAGAVNTTLSENNIVVAYYNRKRGAFIPVVGSGGGVQIIRFEVLAAGPFLGDVATECDSVTAEVLGISCEGADVAVGDEVVVWDPSRCNFNIPIEVLIGAHGMAAYMINYAADVSDCEYELLAEGACRWVVQTLCCAEDIYA